MAGVATAGEKTSFLRHFVLKPEHLPRQARDKHTGKTQKGEIRFVAVLRRASNIGFIAPVAVVRLFLNAYETKGHFPGIGPSARRLIQDRLYYYCWNNFAGLLVEIACSCLCSLATPLDCGRCR